MRNLRRNQRNLFYASYMGNEMIVDEYGNETLEPKKTYSEPKSLKICYSSNVGAVDTQVFGDVSSYSRVLSYTGTTCPLMEKDVLWIGKETSEKPNYEVVKVADNLNTWLIAVQEIV
jgi:hypothetical protein